MEILEQQESQSDHSQSCKGDNKAELGAPLLERWEISSCKEFSVV